MTQRQLDGNTYQRQFSLMGHIFKPFHRKQMEIIEKYAENAFAFLVVHLQMLAAAKLLVRFPNGQRLQNRLHNH